MIKHMNAKDAKALTDERQAKYEKRRNKHIKWDLNTIHWTIRSRARHGYHHARWDYRDSMDKEAIKQKLINEGYRVDDSIYPYYEIIWEEEEKFIRKK